MSPVATFLRFESSDFTFSISSVSSNQERVGVREVATG